MTRNTNVEAEIGRIPCVVYDKLASRLRPKEYIYSIPEEELEHLVVPGSTYRKSADILNRVLHRSEDKTFRTSTLENHIVSGGQKINAAMHAKAHEILTEIPDISETGVIENAAEIPESIKSPAPESDAADADKASAFADVISRYNEGKKACDQIKDHVAGGKTAPTVPIYG